MRNIPMETPIAGVYWVDRGVVVRERQFDEWEDALRAARVAAEVAA